MICARSLPDGIYLEPTNGCISAHTFREDLAQPCSGAGTGCPAVLYVDLHLVTEVTSPQAFTGLRQRGLKVRRADKTIATLITRHQPFLVLRSWMKWLPARSGKCSLMRSSLAFDCTTGTAPARYCARHRPRVRPHPAGHGDRFGDSHTATHGAFGALAFGIGTSEVEHVLATQCLLQNRPKTCEVRLDGRLAPGVMAKDIILALIAQIGVGGGTGHVFEYTGSAIRSLSMEARMTVCNMSIEGGARAGMVAPDETPSNTWQDGNLPRGAKIGRPPFLAGEHSQPMEARCFDRTVTLDPAELVPMITYGTTLAWACRLPGASRPRLVFGCSPENCP